MQIDRIPGDTRGWPWIADPNNVTPEDHAAHTTPKGIPYPETLGMKSKAHKDLFKGVKATHPKLTKRAPKMRKKHR